MTKPKNSARLWIEKLTVRGSVARDVLHGPGLVVIGEMDVDADVGGDVIHTEADDDQPLAPPPDRSIRKLVIHAVTGVLSIASMVAASGVAMALGWS